MSSTTAIYLRISREEEQFCESIENQRRMLRRYVREVLGQKEEPLEFCDQGYSGTNFQRPGFQALLSAMDQGQVRCLVVKDLSRLGREYIETGYYVERYFPLRGIRFIAVNDKVDTGDREWCSGGNMLLLSVKNIINDEYARDISGKVKSALRAKKQSGIFAVPFAPYGYRICNGILEEKPEESQVVRRIFSWREEGVPIRVMAGWLNFLAVPSPSLAKRRESNYHNGNCKKEQWSYQSIYRILKNSCYEGRAELGKTERISHKVKKSVATAPQQRIYLACPKIHNNCAELTKNRG